MRGQSWDDVPTQVASNDMPTQVACNDKKVDSTDSLRNEHAEDEKSIENAEEPGPKQADAGLTPEHSPRQMRPRGDAICVTTSSDSIFMTTSKRAPMDEKERDMVDSGLLDLTLWEKAICVMRTPGSGSNDVIGAITQFLSSSDEQIDKFGCVNIMTWHELHAKEMEYNQTCKKLRAMEPLKTRLQLVTRPCSRLIYFLSACGADGDGGFLWMALLLVIMIATFPFW